MDNDYSKVIAFVVVGLILIGVFAVIHIANDKERAEKGCGEEHTTFTHKVFQCPEGKPYIRLSVLGKSAHAYCCAKE